MKSILKLLAVQLIDGKDNVKVQLKLLMKLIILQLIGKVNVIWYLLMRPVTIKPCVFAHLKMDRLKGFHLQKIMK